MNPLTRKIFMRLSAALCAVGFVLTAHAAGLGAIAVQSNLGQPLTAEIALTSLQAGEFDEIRARIASRDAYESARLAYIPVLGTVRIVPDRRADGQAVLKISSNAAINEPVLDLLVEFTWGGGKILQKYSILLDPAK